MVRATTSTVTSGEVANRARTQADAAGRAAGIHIEVLDHRAELALITRIVDRIWRPSLDDPPVTSTILRALAHSGNYCAVAFTGREPIGVCVAFMGIDPEATLHSHLAGVVPESANRHVGWALKLDQRAWALERDVARVTWTFDPLVRRNAYFNLHKLGVAIRSYEIDFYGTLTDDINQGQGSDRLVATWDLLAPAVDARCAGQTPAVEFGPLAGRATVVLDLDDPIDHAPAAAHVHRLIGTPENVQTLRVDRPEQAARWRIAVRESLGGLMGSGWHVEGFSRDGYYILSTGPEAGEFS